MHPIEDYALLSNCRSVALVSKAGSVDWFCPARFDAPACFAALLGNKENGHWRIAPTGEIRSVSRHYRKDTLIVETEFHCETGAVILRDFLSIREEAEDLIRLLVGVKGEVEVEMTLLPRFEYGKRLPLITQLNGKWLARSGADQLAFFVSRAMQCTDCGFYAKFTVTEGQEIPFQLSYTASHHSPADIVDAAQTLKDTEAFWHGWLCDEHMDERIIRDEFARRSVLTLKALTYRPTGGIIAAATTSLPESPGGIRNWDYRFCWPRDASLAMHAVISAGKKDEIEAWRHWLLRACAGVPEQVEVLYGLFGESPPSEQELTWLTGHAHSKPVRIGNKAHNQQQHDIFGYILDIFYTAEKKGLPHMHECWELAVEILAYLERIWQEPDKGIWEMRGPMRHFVHSKAMIWVAYDRGIRAAEEFGITGPIERWRKMRQEVFDAICEKGFSREKNSFVQFYGSKAVDASLLQLPFMDFLPVDDPRIEGTVKAIEEDLTLQDGFIMRYLPSEEVEGLPPSGQHAFLLCQCWLGIVYARQGRKDKAREIYDRLQRIANDAGLLAEQYDPKEKCLRGNFPQAFSHLGIILLYLALEDMEEE